MEILIVVITTLIIILRIGSKIQKRKTFNELSTDNKNKLNTDQRRKEDEELITVIIPTINHDGK